MLSRSKTRRRLDRCAHCKPVVRPTCRLGEIAWQVVGSVLAISVTAAVAEAQTAQPAPENTPAGTQATDQTSSQLQEVVVSAARKHEERLIDVPAVVQVVSSEEMERYRVIDAKDLTQYAPNVAVLPTFAGTGGTIAIRGIASASANSDPGVDPEVAFNIDGINITQGRVSTLGLLDTDHIEILEGPQALYFGKNNPAGVIAIKSVDPSSTQAAYVQFGYEYYLGKYDTRAAFNVPVTDTLSIRVALMGDEQRGYLRNAAVPVVDPFGYAPLIDPGPVNRYTDGSHQLLGRLSIKYTPTDRFTALIKYLYAYYHANSDGANQVVLCPRGVNNYVVNANFGFVATDPGDPNCSQHVIAIEGGLNPSLAAHFPSSNGGVPYSQPSNQLTSADLTYNFDHLTINSISGYYDMHSRALVGIESSFPFFIGAQTLSYNQATEELRATTKFSGPVNYMFGGYFEHSRYRWQGNNYILPLGADTVTGRIDSETYRDVATDRTYSAYGSLDWKLPANWELSAGARWTHESKLAVEENLYLNDQPQIRFGFPFFEPVGQQIVSPTTGNNVSPEVTLTWHARPDLNIYGALKTGYKSGGTSTAEVLNITTAANLSFKPEKAIGGELGVKGQWLDRTLRATFDVYTYNFTNLQVTSLTIVPNAPLVFRINNAAGARTQGAEFQADYKVTRNWEVRGHLDYNKAFYSDYKNAPCSADQLAGLLPGCVTQNGVSTTDLTGERLAPEWYAGGGGVYRHDISNAYVISFAADLNYQSSVPRSGLSEFTVQSGYSLLSANIILANTAKNWRLALTGTNLTDVTSYAGIFPINGTGNKVYSALRQPPREVALTYSYDF